jgi:alkylated DNA nucleotide flippase Atl1
MNYDRMSDLEIARYLVCSIPAGRWTNYGEIADAIEAFSPGRELNAASNAGWRVAMMLLHTGPAPWHRLRNKEGMFVVPNSERRDHEVVQREVDDALRAEGCRVDLTGFADPRNWIGERELVRLAKPAEQRAHVEEAEDARKERVRRELEERRARRRKAEAQRHAWLKRKAR